MNKVQIMFRYSLTLSLFIDQECTSSLPKKLSFYLPITTYINETIFHQWQIQFWQSWVTTWPPLAIDIIINERKIEKPALSNIVIGLIANRGIQLSESNKTKWTLHVKSLFLLRSYGYYLIKNSSQKEILKYECSKIF